jgi:hypothetical protein
MPSRRTSFPSLGGTTDLTILFVSPAPPRELGPVQAWMFTVLPLAIHAPSLSPGGALRVSQVPGESSRTFAMLKRPRPRRHASPFYGAPVLPPLVRPRRPQLQVNFEADSHGFSTRCLRFQIRLSLHWQDSLPVGGEPLPDGI